MNNPSANCDTPVFTLIAARAANGVIGREGDLPWRIPADMRFFRRMTMGKPVLMGRKTFESIGRPLPKRRNIVISRNPDCRPEGVDIAPDIATAIDLAVQAATEMQCNEIMVIGGETIYRALLPRAGRLCLTEVEAEFEGDAHFPDFNRSDWRLVCSEPGSIDDDLPFTYRFDSWERAA